MKQKNQRYALLSVFDKAGIVDFAEKIGALGFKIIATNGTAKLLQENKIPVIPIWEITGNPESFDGRVKTISFQIESGILFDRNNPKHVKEAKRLEIKPIDLVVCNLYPFEETIKNPQVSLETAIENIDVGGPTMIRAAAKNFKSVIILTDPSDYQSVIEPLKRGNLSNDERKKLAAKAFAHLSFYDSQIANYLSSEQFPSELTLAGRYAIDLRYGENPHQKGALYFHPNTNSSLQRLKKHWGRDLSLTNVTDINAGLESVRLFEQPTAVVIKHNSPCGIALGKSVDQALERAIDADPESAFGGVIVLNKKMDKKAAQIIAGFKEQTKGNMDIIAVPDIDSTALELLKSLRKTMGVYTFGQIAKKRSHNFDLKWIDGGFAIEDHDIDFEASFKLWSSVTKKKPTKKQLELAHVAWKFIARIRSNAIIVVDKQIPMTRGIGSGQTSRIRSTKIALDQAGKHAKDAILASDSFFPFDDSVKLAAKAGIAVVLQQGGSINDRASIEAADKAGIAMIFTNQRVFWH